MIGNISKGRDFRGLARYLHGPGHRNEHEDARTIAAAGTLVLDPHNPIHWVHDMEMAASLNRRVENTVWHCSLSAAPEDPYLTDDTWAAFAGEYMKRMGFTDNPWTATRHGDDHIHIVASRVDWDGKCWKDSNDRHRSKGILRILEKLFGLTIVNDNYVPKDPAHAMTSIAEREAAQRKGLPMPERARLRDDITEALKASQGLGVQTFEIELSRRQLGFRRNFDEDGRMRGYSVTVPGWVDAEGAPIWVRCGAVSRELAWPNVAPQLARPQKKPNTAVYRPITSATPKSGR